MNLGIFQRPANYYWRFFYLRQCLSSESIILVTFFAKKVFPLSVLHYHDIKKWKKRIQQKESHSARQNCRVKINRRILLTVPCCKRCSLFASCCQERCTKLSQIPDSQPKRDCKIFRSITTQPGSIAVY